jgi:hypothetical protein
MPPAGSRTEILWSRLRKLELSSLPRHDPVRGVVFFCALITLKNVY